MIKTCIIISVIAAAVYFGFWVAEKVITKKRKEKKIAERAADVGRTSNTANRAS